MRVIDDLLTNYQHVIDELAITTGAGGVFDVTVDGTTIYSKLDTGRHAEPGEVLAAFAEFVGPVTRYGQ